MIVVWLIGVLLCAFAFHILKTCKVQKKERKGIGMYWYLYDWEDTDSKIAYPRILYILFILFALIPVLNIIMCIAIVAWYTEQYKGPRWNNGDKLIALRIKINSDIINWLMKAV